jgi:glycosyltransferase involved in cell wall biosynthesis
VKERKNKKVPCVLFAFNRPETFAQVVSAVRTQDVDHILVFIDGPRNERDLKGVEECKSIAKGIDWVGVDYIIKEKNEGLAGISNNISAVFKLYDSAVFIEDDCLPMPGFYSVMKQALERYEKDKRVFSIGGYQQIQNSYFESYPHTFVSSLRFMVWGWASWQDRWGRIAPYLSGDKADLTSYRDIPDTAGDDLVSFARDFSRSGKRRWEASSWDIRAAILALYFKKVHLLPTRGLIRNIGLDTGSHFMSDQANEMVFNRNVYDKKFATIAWLDDTRPDEEYNRRLKASVDSARNYFSEKAAIRTLNDNPMTLAEIIAKVPYVLSLIRNDPVRTINKISFRLTGKPVNALMGIQRQRKITDYREYLPAGKNVKPKRALLSYLVEPVWYRPSKRDKAMFSNPGIAQYIPRALNELGYRVDIINHDNRQFNVTRKYDLFVGHEGTNYELILRQLPPDAVKIYFSTGNYWEFSNNQETERFEYLNSRRSIILPYDRYIHNDQEFANRNADGIICVGSDFARETYSKFPMVIPINNAAFPDEKYRYDEKDFNEGRKNFLFYSGPGNVHKGLDLLLDVFLKTNNHLYIYTIIEPLFEKAFHKELNDVPNIHLMGYVHLHNPKIYAVINRCNFVILPSCSEGQPGSVVECMHKGLIPIVSREANIDTDDFGITLDNCSVETILRVVEEVSAKSPEWCRERSLRTRNTARQNYTTEKFLQNMKDAIEYIIGQKTKATIPVS